MPDAAAIGGWVTAAAAFLTALGTYLRGRGQTKSEELTTVQQVYSEVFKDLRESAAHQDEIEARLRAQVERLEADLDRCLEGQAEKDEIIRGLRGLIESPPDPGLDAEETNP